VYIFRSDAFPDQSHVGSTIGLRKRVAERNSGRSIHTNKFRPWDLMAYIALPEILLAGKSEHYLKIGPGGKR
jgi:hypothetical protein